MKKLIIYVFVLIAIWNSVGCKFQSDKKSDSSLNVDSFELKKQKALDPDEWGCFTVGEDIICAPSKWHSVKTKVVHYFSYLDNSDKNTFFTIAKYNIAKDKINATGYLKEGYSQLLKDTVEIFNGYTIKEIIMRDRKNYYGEYFTTVKNQKYFAYSMIFENDGFLYDICLKVEKSKSPYYRDIFSEILFKTRFGGMLVFDEKDEIQKTQVIDLSKL